MTLCRANQKKKLLPECTRSSGNHNKTAERGTVTAYSRYSHAVESPVARAIVAMTQIILVFLLSVHVEKEMCSQFGKVLVCGMPLKARMYAEDFTQT